MNTRSWSERGGVAIVALLATVIAFLVASTMMPRSAAHSTSDDLGVHVSDHAAPPGCHYAGSRDGKPDKRHSSCCGACALTAAPRLDAAPDFCVLRIAEISTRFDFASRLGRDLDDSPADLRSRAPPRRI
jgi:hypothetical protein